jgi:cation transport ATPase
MSKTRTEWFSTFRYMVPADYENWMEKLAADGWNIDKIGQWSSIRMVFKKTDPKQYRYIFDIHTSAKRDYLETYRQFGWEFVGQMASCFIWRKEYTAIRPESFTDLESIEKRNRNVMNAVMVSFILFTVITLVMIAATLLSSSSMSSEETLQMVLFTACAALFSTYLGWVVWKIYHNRDR